MKKVYWPTSTFVEKVDGVVRFFEFHKTVVREGDPVLKQHPEKFEQVLVWETREVAA